MADDKKVKKKKKVKEEEPAPAPAPAPAPEPAAPAPSPAVTPAATPASSKPSSRKSSSKKAKKTGSNVFDMFTQRQVAEFKEGFQMMDRDKDGIIGKSDLRAVFDDVGKIATDKELEDMLGEAPAPINFTMLLQMFAERNSGSSDDDDVVAAAFNAFSQDGWIDGDMFRHALMTWGDRYSAQEADDAFDQFDMDDRGFIDTAAVIEMLTGKGDVEGEA
ncbi:myosin regulatory light chain 2-like [Penaeus monodon]|uniref:myosin regulatory light chain 2-like n=1 Tax=Penaeus monodon TaxID=6687 RepID=UPI0018A74E32|nr:myosin regulatory light chain 2-like [Penaeus monodon]